MMDGGELIVGVGDCAVVGTTGSPAGFEGFAKPVLDVENVGALGGETLDKTVVRTEFELVVASVLPRGELTAVNRQLQAELTLEWLPLQPPSHVGIEPVADGVYVGQNVVAKE
jgi:hypothetical protein